MPPTLLALLAAAATLSKAPPDSPVGPGDREAAAAGSDTAEPGPSLRVHTERVESDAVARGLDSRVGPDWHAWTIDVEAGADAATVDVALRDPAGQTHTRTLTLMSESTDARSRELASALALLIEQLPAAPPQPPPPSTDPTPAASPEPSGWVGVGPRAGLNAKSPVDPDVGVSAAGGAWLLRGHVQPVAEITWSTWTRDTLRLDALRFGAGVLGGVASPRGRLWGGGGVLMRAQWARAAAATTATGWWASPAVVAALQYRGRILFAGAWLGVDLSLPPLVARDRELTLRWASVRPMGTVHVGVRLPPRRTSR